MKKYYYRYNYKYIQFQKKCHISLQIFHKISEHTIAGAIAGLVEVLIMYPLDVVKLGLN